MPDSYKSTEDPQAMTLHAGNGTFQQEERNGEVKSDVAENSSNDTQTWQVFSHEIRVKTGFPGSESWSQKNGHNGKLSFDSLELEKVTLILPVEEDQAFSQPATYDLETLAQENGHNGEVSFDSLELEEKTLKLSVVKGQALAQPATDDLELLSQEDGHNGKVSFDSLELEKVTLILPVEEGQALAQPATSELTVVIPTRNERDNIMPLLHELQEALDGMRVEIIFVDDSDDDTPLIIEDASLAMEASMFHVHLEHRQPGTAREGGLATAVVHGMNRAQAEYVAVIDADLQHPPEQLRMFYNQAVAQNADLVVASRYIKGGSYQGLAGAGRRFVSVGLKWTAKLLFPEQLLSISDPLGGFFLLRRSLLADVSLRPIGYKILLEILIRCPWRQVLEVPYHFQARAHGQSKANMQQGILSLRHMLRLWREVPAAGRVWKISILILLNVLITLALFIVNKSFPWVWANLNIVIIGVMACLDFVLFNRFIFPLKVSFQRNTIPTTPIVDANTDGQFEVMRYAEWLTAEAKRNNNGSHQEESNQYAEDALKTVTVNGQEFRPFAPFRQALSAYKTLTRGQAVALSTIMLGCGLGLLFYGIKLVTVIMAMITLLYLCSLLLDFLLTMRALSQSTEEHIDDVIVHSLADADWPRYTILCPLYHEAEVVPQFVQAMQALDYPTDKLQILFLTEEDDAETRKAIEALRLPQHFSIVTVPAGQPRTKPRACNFGLLRATGDYVVIYDAEDIPDPLQLKKAVLTFANHDSDLACVQAKLNYYNTNQNLLTRWFTVEYSLWFDLMLPGMQQTKLPLPLGGTSNHFRTETLCRVGAWDPFNVTEDCDLGLRLASSRLKTTVLNSTTYEEANSQVKNWIRQRSRWIKGYLLTYLVYMRQPLRYLRQGRLREFLSLQLVIGGKTAVLFVNPLMWALLAIYILLRPIVGDVYYILFPAPVLYMGTLCLIFGNFFYTYSHLVGCMRRSQYSLIKWALSIPIYWAMMSIAASLALSQLIFKPHYWEKTKHGLHLRKPHSSSGSTTVEEETQSVATMQLPAFTTAGRVSPPLPSSRSSSTSTPVTKDLESKVTVPLAAFGSVGHLSRRLPKRPAWRQWLKDPWLVATFVIACIASSAACWYFFQHHQILLQEDAVSHLRIARRVFDNTPPGFGQLGGVWLPLPHLLMLPFVWNDCLWRTGLAGSFAGMFCYMVSVIYLFLSARRLTQDSRASFVGTLLFILNPDVLYVQATPLTEPVCIATIVIACYYFLAWTQDGHIKHLVGMAAGCFLATIARYDGWGLFLVLLVSIVVVSWIKRQHWEQIESNLLVFGTLGALGIGLWMLWCWVIMGDPLYFHHITFSFTNGSQFANTTFYTYHNMQESILAYMVLSIKTIGPILFVLAFIAFVVFGVRFRRTPSTVVGAVAFLTPFAFYILILYFGQDTIYLPGVGAPKDAYELWNVRFGTEAVAPAAFFLSILAMRWSITRLARLWGIVGSIVLVISICIQTILIAHGGILPLQDAQYGYSCNPTEPITIYLAQHYAGGRILEDVSDYRIIEADVGAADLKDFIYEGSTGLWKKALNDPASTVEWIIVSPDAPDDPIAKHIDLKSPAFLSQFTLVVQERDNIFYSVYHIRLYHRKGRPPLPTRPIPSSLLTEHSLCRAPGDQASAVTMLVWPW